MSSTLRSITSLLCAVLLLGWTSAATSGLISFCAGDDHGPCGHGLYHAWLPGDTGCCEDHHGPEASLEVSDGAGAFLSMSAAPSGCPSDHRHTALSLEMSLPSSAAALVPQLIEFFAVPLPPLTGRSECLSAAIASIPEAVPPGPPPLHEACAPLLI